MSASGCPCRASVLSYFTFLSRLVFPCPVTGVLVGCSTSWQKGSLRPIVRIAVCLHGCGPFSFARREIVTSLEIGVWGRFDVEIAQNAVPAGLCAVGPGMRALDFGLVMELGKLVGAYLYMVAAGCQGRQAIAERCIDMSQRADAVPVHPESTGLCTFHEEYQAFLPSVREFKHLFHIL